MKLVLLFTLFSTYLLADQTPMDDNLFTNSPVKVEQNKIDSLAPQDLNMSDTTVIMEQSEDSKKSLRIKNTSKADNQDLYPAVGSLDKAFLVATDFCTTTLTKWDQFLQRMITKINNKLNKTHQEQSK